MEFDVPTARRERPKPTVPASGKYKAKVKDFILPDEDYSEFTLKWRFRAEETDPRFKPGRYYFTLDHMVTSAELLDVLVDLGLAGQKVNRDAIMGKQAMIVVQSLGGRNSARVFDTEPVPAES